ncbi:hypothetical protein J3R83DRAFT_9682 [Lanmaoa asiatica]|nr:hypothetical protein J3R83DRAFT_9682 [Lanmaoa asiatica]
MDGGVPVRVVHHPIGGVRTIDVSSDSKWVITGSDARTADVWDVSTGERRPSLGPLKHEYNVVGVKFCPCGQRIATVTLFGSIRIYATSSGQKLLTIPVSVMSTLSSSNITLAWFANPTRPQLFAVSQGQVKCIDPNDGSVIFQWPLRGVSHPASITLSPSNKVIAYSSNATVVLRDIATGQQIGDTLKHSGNVSCLAFSPGSDQLVVGADTKFTIWDLRKRIADPSYFVDTTMEHAESCAHHKQDAVQKSPPSTFSLPLMNISNGAVKPWLHGYLDSAEEVLSKEIGDSAFVPNHNTFANRALLRGRLGKGSMALEDAEKSLLIQTSAIGQIAKTIATIHQGKHELTRQEIFKVLKTGHSEKYTFFLKVIQSILFCLSGEYDREVSDINELSGDQKLVLLVQANMHLSKKQFEAAMQSFKKACVPTLFPYDETKEMWTISFVIFFPPEYELVDADLLCKIFGWKFSGLGILIQQRKCEFLLHVGNPGAADLFLEVKDAYQREIATHAELSSWALAFGRDCLKKLEDLGDKALASGDYNEAIKQYKAAGTLMPRAIGRLLGALLTQSADVTILAWTGKPSEYNTCLPAEITVYQESEALHVPDSIGEAKLAASALNVLSGLSPADLNSAVKLHDRLLDLPPPELHHGRLKLPCFWFPLPPITENPNSHSYTVIAPFLGEVELKTTDDLSSSRNMVLVHPWFSRLLDPGISLLDSARHESASRLLAALRQPFGALLLAWNRSSRDYQRIAADQLIRVQIREDVFPGQLLETYVCSTYVSGYHLLRVLQ